jgi:16S rRNA (guanine966-N2)-methyltransferase
MLDAKKEAVFNVMGQFFDGGVVLDLFGGSGALSLEALSRGCSFSYIVEQAQDAYRIISRNVNSLGESSRVKLLNMDYQQALRIFQKEGLKFDYVFLDPPFRMKVLAEIIDFLLTNEMVNQGGYLVCQYLVENYTAAETEHLRIVKQYNYKRSELTIYEKK